MTTVKSKSKPKPNKLNSVISMRVSDKTRKAILKRGKELGYRKPSEILDQALDHWMQCDRVGKKTATGGDN